MKKRLYIALLLLSVSVMAQITVNKKLKITDTPNTVLPSEILVKTTGNPLVKATTFSQLVTLMQSNLTFTTDTNTQLSNSQVGTAALAEGFVKGAHTQAVDLSTYYHTGNLTLATLGFTGDNNANYITNNNQLTNGAEYFNASNFVSGVNYQTPLSNVAFTNVNNKFSVDQTFSGDINIRSGIIDGRSAFFSGTVATTAIRLSNKINVGNGLYAVAATQLGADNTEEYTLSVGANTGNKSATFKKDIEVGGNGKFAGTATASNFIIGSDKRLKTNIIPISEEETLINYKQFERKNSPGQLRYGVIAQELEVYNPQLVYTDENGMKSVAYIDLLIREIAFLKREVKLLKKKSNE